MQNTQIIAERIKERAKQNDISVKKLLEICELGPNTVQKLSKGTDLVSQNLVKIADYLDCSTDYLLGRVDTPNATYSITGDNNVQVNGNNGNNSPLTVNSKNYDETTKELVQLVQSLSLIKRAEAILYLNELNAKK